MVQSRICSYFKPVCNHVSREPTTFLSLPEHIRHEVYLQVGLVTDASVRVVARNGVYFFSTEFYDWPGAGLDLPINLYSTRNGVPFACSNLSPAEFDAFYELRLVSRVVNTDLVRCLVSNNDILLDRADVLGNVFAILVGSPLGLLQWLRRLTIVLDNTITDRVSISCLHETLAHASTSTKFKNFQPAWEKLIRHLALSPNSSKLELKLACNFEDAAVARLLLQPLEQLQVAKCTIQLTGKRNAVLENIARETVLCSTLPDIRTRGYFRFLELPTELRQHILSFTDLVTPFREIMWSPNTTFKLSDSRERHYCPYWNHGFCTTQSFAVPACACWQPPVPMFLVCRTMLHDARAIFFRSNRFIIAEPYKCWTSPAYRGELFEASIFLTQIVPGDGLASLRDLEIQFPPKEYCHLGIGQAMLDDWENAIRYAAPRLRKLTLSLIMGIENHPDPPRCYTEDAQADLQKLYQVHEQIVRPLSQLRCLDGFFVTAWACFDHEHWTRERHWLHFQEHAKNLEAVVMGSTYDSEACGKTQRRRSKWLDDRYR